MLWSGLATQDARLASHALGRMPPIPPSTSWVTYVRGHDDIGWAVSDTDAWSVGVGGFGHRRFLNDFYSGRFPGSFARGALFQENEATGDARISGSAASLCGIEDALERGDAVALERGIRRLVLLYSVIYAFGGIPLLYMGDELALRNDAGYLDDPSAPPDNRWMHRPPMDWAAARAARTRPRWRAGCSRRCSGWARRGGRSRCCAVAASARSSTSATRPSWPGDGARAQRDLRRAGQHEPAPRSVDADTVTGFGTFEAVLTSDGPAGDPRRGASCSPGLGYAWFAEP